MECDPPNTSLHSPFHFAPMMVSSGLNRAHNNDTTIIKDVRCVVGFIQPETVNESSKITNTCYDIDMGQQMVHEKQLAISIPSGDYLTTSKNLSSLRENSSEIVNILPHNTEVHTDYLIDSLKNKIFETVKKIDNKIFSDIDATDLTLWKVEIHDADFSKLELKNNGAERTKKIQKIVSDYWKEQPSTEIIHVIVNSPSLHYKQENAELQEEIRIIQDARMFNRS
ncbi:hypothetical protein RhiirA1_402499 [Rhizophagus irregularis]|uniref:Crinkler effector protein N-terminal domain-containing protein n=1 Tax=Rhizophagus irregularis TaxID=588596 RepID=A0A2N0QY09_9GLOM|nr:hypothetical protein RhiirA1_402499 [Rhizophagus irregularis]